MLIKETFLHTIMTAMVHMRYVYTHTHIKQLMIDEQKEN